MAEPPKEGEGFPARREIILSSRKEELRGTKAYFSKHDSVFMGLGSEAVIGVPHLTTDQSLAFVLYNRDRLYPFTRPTIRIGRVPERNGEENDVVLQELTVSGRQCTINLGQDRYDISDPGSSNGTDIRVLRSIGKDDGVINLKRQALIAKLGRDPLHTDIGGGSDGAGNFYTLMFSLDVQRGLMLFNTPITELLKRKNIQPDPSKPLSFTVGSSWEESDITFNGRPHIAPRHMRVTLMGDVIKLESLENKYGVNVAANGQDLINRMSELETTPPSPEQQAETLGKRIFNEGAGYLYGSLFEIPGLTPFRDHSGDGLSGYSQGLVFIQGKKFSFENRTEVNDLNYVFGISDQEHPLTSELKQRYRNSHVWVKELNTSGNAQFKGYKLPSDWIRFAFVGFMDGARGRTQLARFVLPRQLAQTVDGAITQNPQLALEIVKTVYPGIEQLNIKKSSELVTIDRLHIADLDRHLDKQKITVVPYSK